MEKLKEFIEVTSVVDGRKAIIRAASIDSVADNAEQKGRYTDVDGQIKWRVVEPECRTILYSGASLDVIESYDDIIDMIFKAEM